MSTNKTSLENESQPSCLGAVMHWVAVSERLPEHRQRVLFNTHNRDVHKAIYMDKLINQHGDFEKVFMSTDGGHYQLEMGIVQYWMPLPEPPCA